MKLKPPLLSRRVRTQPRISALRPMEEGFRASLMDIQAVVMLFLVVVPSYQLRSSPRLGWSLLSAKAINFQAAAPSIRSRAAFFLVHLLRRLRPA
jgi:hypothetical protein